MDKIFENRLIFEEGPERSANSPVGFCSEQPTLVGTDLVVLNDR